MKNFFHGWRRNVGCITLALACVFTAAWLRSYQRHDLLWLETTHFRGMVYSSTGGLSVWIHESRRSSSPYGWLSEEVNREERGSQVEYWQLVLPFVVLSAYLILGKPPNRANDA